MARQLNGFVARLPSTLHHPNGAQHRFDEQRVQALVLKWQGDQDPALLNEILLACEPIITGVVISRSSYVEDLNELLHLLRNRVWKKLAGYDPNEGRIFTYVTLVANQGLIDVWSKKSLYAQRYAIADISTLDHLKYSAWAKVSSTEVYEDIWHQIRQIKTTCTLKHELAAQRWLVVRLFQLGFKLRRHHAANGMSIEKGIEPARSRQLHDATLLEIRRQLLPIVEIPEIEVADLCGTRAIALAKYADRLSNADFSKLVYLMRNLPPVIIEEGRIDWVLNGYPGARLLFA